MGAKIKTPKIPRPNRIESLWRRANARNFSFRISLRWLIYIVNSVDKTKLSWKLESLANGKEIPAVPFRMEKEEYLWRYSTISKRNSRKLPYHLTLNQNFQIFSPNGKHPKWLLFKIPIVVNKKSNKLEKSSSYPIESRLYTLGAATSRHLDWVDYYTC